MTRRRKSARCQIPPALVVITPVDLVPLTVAQRLALFDPARHGGEAMEAPLKGAERP